MDLKKQKEHFKNHIAKFTDYGNIKILDFKNPNSSEYRIRFLFEEDYCRLHISGDLGELIATNYSNMTYEKFSDFVNDVDYFKEKIDCNNRKHHPIKSKQGKTFEKFVQQLTELGYEVQYRELIAADYGAPTMRKRFFLIARCDGKPIVWPEPTHGPADSAEVNAGLRLPYVGAYTQLDFSLPCPSIFDTSEEIKEKYGIRAVRPLAKKTMDRIARGVKKFVLDNPDPFIIKDESDDIKMPILIQYHSETTKDEVRGQGIEDPIMTVDSSNRYGLVTSFISKFYKSGTGQDAREPLHTITAGDGHFGEVRAFLTKYYGVGVGQSIKEPLDTITSRDRFGLVTVHGTKYQIMDIGLRMLEPKELYGCQGFPEDYIIDRDCDGKSYPRAEQVRRCGNAVCPPIPAALVRANLKEMCVAKRLSNCRADRLGQDDSGQLRFA